MDESQSYYYVDLLIIEGFHGFVMKHLLRHFLKSFQDWPNSVQKSQGNFDDAGQKTFISWKTYAGLKISVNSIIELPNFSFDIRLSMY